MKTMKKILVGMICWVVVTGFLLYEGYSIVKKEYIRQTEIAAEAHEKVNFNLDMIKISVMTEDIEAYEKNLAEAKEQIGVISPLGLIHDKQADYLDSLREYTELLDSKLALLKEIRLAKTKVVAVKDKMSENYGDKDTLTRDKLKEAKDNVTGFKIDAGEFTDEKVIKVISSVNGVLDGVSEKAETLADCIDTCYKNRINEISNELAEKLKSFAESIDELNAELEKEFAFDKMSSLRNWKIEEDNE